MLIGDQRTAHWASLARVYDGGNGSRNRRDARGAVLLDDVDTIGRVESVGHWRLRIVVGEGPRWPLLRFRFGTVVAVMTLMALRLLLFLRLFLGVCRSLALRVVICLCSGCAIGDQDYILRKVVEVEERVRLQRGAATWHDVEQGLLASITITQSADMLRSIRIVFDSENLPNAPQESWYIEDGEIKIDQQKLIEFNRRNMPNLTPIEFDTKLKNNGLYDVVQELIKDHFEMRIAYNRATFFSRTDSFVDQARIALSLTDEQVDAIWESSFV